MSQSKDAHEKVETDLKDSWSKCSWFRRGYRHWRAKATHYSQDLACFSFVISFSFLQTLVVFIKNIS